MSSSLFERSIMAPSLVGAKARTRLQMYEQALPGTVLRFGIPSLDNLIQLVKSNYYLVAARPGVGKTAFMLQTAGIIANQLPDDRPVVIFSAEMDAGALALREASARTGLSYWDAVTRRLSPEQYVLLYEAIDRRSQSNIWVDESSSPTLAHMEEQCDTVGTPGLILFDYLQLAGEIGQGEKQRIDDISRGLAALAKKFDCPVLALGQANRQRGDQPGMANLMYGGEQQPSGIIILERPWLDDHSQDPHLINAYVVKHRHGPGGHVRLYYHPESMRFDDSQRIPLNGG